MVKRSIADSNVLISYFVKDSNFYLAEKVLSSGVFINLMIFTEVTNFIQNKFSVEKACWTSERILKNASLFNFLAADFDLLHDTQKLMHRYLDNRLSFVDCFILTQAEKYGLEVLSSDTRMGNYDKVQVVNPFNLD